MKLLTWNVGLVGDVFRKFMCVFDKREISIQKICRRINIENPDLIALQEVYNDNFELINDNIKTKYNYSVHEQELGLCFFSKHKINKEYTIIFPRDIISNCVRSKNGLLIVRQQNTHNFFCNVHLSCGLGCKYEYNYLDIVKKVHKNNNLVFMGDFNAFRTTNFNKIASQLNFTVNNNNDYCSYNHPFLKCNYDYIIEFKKNKIGTEPDTTCINDNSSDHFPIICNI